MTARHRGRGEAEFMESSQEPHGSMAFAPVLFRQLPPPGVVHQDVGTMRRCLCYGLGFSAVSDLLCLPLRKKNIDGSLVVIITGLDEVI